MENVGLIQCSNSYYIRNKVITRKDKLTQKIDLELNWETQKILVFEIKNKEN